jgi:hypothetical protein
LIACAAIITAFIPLPQTLLIVAAGTLSGIPPRADDVAHDHLVHLLGLDAAARDRLAHDARAELRGLQRRQRPLEPADRRPYRTHDHGVLHRRLHGVRSSLCSLAGALSHREE